VQAAIDRVTRALATADDDVIADLVAERRALREDLRALRGGDGSRELDNIVERGAQSGRRGR
jgi:hypothetical protein